jgi:hypothetical protein
MDTNLVLALAIGLLALGAIYLALDVAFPGREPSLRKAKGIFGGAAGLLVAVCYLTLTLFTGDLSSCAENWG